MCIKSSYTGTLNVILLIQIMLKLKLYTHFRDYTTNVCVKILLILGKNFCTVSKLITKSV